MNMQVAGTSQSPYARTGAAEPPVDESEISRLSDKIKLESEALEQSVREQQEAVAKGAKEKAQLLTATIAQKQQAITALRTQISELREGKQQGSAEAPAPRPRYDTFVEGLEDPARHPDVTYRVEQEEPGAKIVFDPPASTPE